MSGADLAQLFLAEAADILDQLEQMLLDLERAPQNLELVDAVFRALHTIKGSGAMFGFTAVASFTHHVENAFDGLRTGRFSPSPELIAVTLAAKDQIRLLIEQPGNARDDVSEAILARLQGLVATPSVLVPLAAKAWSVRFTLPSDAMATGTNPLVLLDELRSLGGAEVQAFTHDVPSLDEIDPVSCYLHWDVTLVTEKTRDDIEQVFIFLMDGLTLDIAPIDIHQDTNESEIAGSGLPQQRPCERRCATHRCSTSRSNSSSGDAQTTEALQKRGQRSSSRRAPRRDDGPCRRTRHRAVSPKPSGSREWRCRCKVRFRGARTPISRTARHHDGHAHDADRFVIRPLSPARP